MAEIELNIIPTSIREGDAAVVSRDGNPAAVKLARVAATGQFSDLVGSPSVSALQKIADDADQAARDAKADAVVAAGAAEIADDKAREAREAVAEVGQVSLALHPSTMEGRGAHWGDYQTGEPWQNFGDIEGSVYAEVLNNEIISPRYTVPVIQGRTYRMGVVAEALPGASGRRAQGLIFFLDRGDVVGSASSLFFVPQEGGSFETQVAVAPTASGDAFPIPASATHMQLLFAFTNAPSSPPLLVSEIYIKDVTDEVKIEENRSTIDSEAQRIRTLEAPRVLTDMSRVSLWGASDMRDLDQFVKAWAEGEGADYFGGWNGGATLDSIWGEQGSRPMIVRFPSDTVPATGTANVTWTNGTQRNAIRPRPVLIKGTTIEGTIEGAGGQMRFTRTGVIAGQSQAVTVPTPVELVSVNGVKQKHSFQIWNVGRNDLALGDVVDACMEAYRSAYAQLDTLDRRVIFVTPYTQQNYPATVIDRVQRLTNDMLSEWRSLVIDQMAYATSQQVWTDTGITPTQADLDAQAAYAMAPSLMKDPAHVNDAYAEAFVNVIKARVAALGWQLEAS